MTNDENTNTWTPEKIELGIKLERIFMPNVRRQRDKLYKTVDGAPQPARFVHYTSAEAALKIIELKRIWMRNSICMSDYFEVQHGFNILQRFFAEKSNLQAFHDALGLCSAGAALESIGLFNQWWPMIRFNTFITSMSEHDDDEDLHGRLSMWRAFGGNSARVAIVFKIPWVSNAGPVLNLIFSPVAYSDQANYEKVLFEVIENIKREAEFLRSLDRSLIIANVFRMLVIGVTCVKHAGFREEREWRAIHTPSYTCSPLMESSTEVVNGIPQVVFKVPLDKDWSQALADLDFASIFDRLIVGPSQFAPPMLQAFESALKKVGVADADKRLFASNIPIRT